MFCIYTLCLLYSLQITTCIAEALVFILNLIWRLNFFELLCDGAVSRALSVVLISLALRCPLEATFNAPVGTLSGLSPP